MPFMGGEEMKLTDAQIQRVIKGQPVRIAYGIMWQQARIRVGEIMVEHMKKEARK
jgi:hypothetical protein